jgi:hypothetical protein
MNGGGTLSPANGDLTVAATSDDLILNAQDDVFIQSGLGSSTKTITFAQDGKLYFPSNLFVNTTVDSDNQTMRIRQGGSNADAALSLDSDTGDQSYYRYMRFYRKGQTSSIAKLDIDFSASTIGLAYTSDERYKDITGDADGLNLITKLKPIKYKWKDGTDLGDGSETQGFGAQSYKQAFDDIGSLPRGVSVPEDEDTEKWTLDYTHLVPNLVKAIQELETEVTNLRARLTAEENK